MNRKVGRVAPPAPILNFETGARGAPRTAPPSQLMAPTRVRLRRWRLSMNRVGQSCRSALIKRNWTAWQHRPTAERLMAPTHVKIFEVFPFHEPGRAPLPRRPDQKEWGGAAAPPYL